MPKTIKLSLSQTVIHQAIKDLEAYRDDLPRKCEALVSKLADRGYITAIEKSGNFGKYIAFMKVCNPTIDGAKALLVASSGTIKAEWLQADGSTSEADVSPLLMVEFGSGWRANKPVKFKNNTMTGNAYAAQFGMGTGTFPKQTHAESPTGWWYLDKDTEEWVHSYGIEPSRPMHEAAMKMQSEIANVVKEVFK